MQQNSFKNKTFDLKKKIPKLVLLGQEHFLVQYELDFF